MVLCKVRRNYCKKYGARFFGQVVYGFFNLLTDPLGISIVLPTSSTSSFRKHENYLHPGGYFSAQYSYIYF